MMGFPGLGGSGFDSIQGGPPPNPPRVEIHQQRRGMVKIPIGSQHIVRGESGAQQSYTVRDASQFRGVATKVLCLARECRGKRWDTIEACLAEHPPHDVMARQNECHPVGWWSEEPAARELREKLAEAGDDAAKAKLLARARKEDKELLQSIPPDRRHTVLQTALPIGLLSDRYPEDQ
jgi:hypothetical protein